MALKYFGVGQRPHLPKGSYSPEYENALEWLEYFQNKATKAGAMAGGAVCSEFGPAASAACAAAGETLGEVFDYSIGKLFDLGYENKDKYIQGNWYRYDPETGYNIPVDAEYLEKSSKIPAGAKFVQDPRWRTKEKEIPIMPILKESVPLIPLKESIKESMPLIPLKVPQADITETGDSGFDINNFDPKAQYAKPGIYLNGITNEEPHPSSRPTFSAAIPSSSQGFYRARIY